MERLDINKQEVDCGKLFKLPNNQAELAMVITGDGRVVLMQNGLTLSAASTLCCYFQAYVTGMIAGGNYSMPDSLAGNPDSEQP